jgi:hypothetical protein
MYALCMTSEEVVYKNDMQSNEIHAARTARNPMQSAVVLSVNTIIPPLLEGKKDGIREFKHDFNAAKTYEEWLPQNSHGGTCRNLQGGVKKAFERIKGAISQSIGSRLGCAFRRNSGGFRRNSDPRHQHVPFRPGTGAGMCYNTNLDIPVYSGWYLSTRFLQVENARTYSK